MTWVEKYVEDNGQAIAISGVFVKDPGIVEIISAAEFDEFFEVFMGAAYALGYVYAGGIGLQILEEIPDAV